MILSTYHWYRKWVLDNMRVIVGVPIIVDVNVGERKFDNVDSDAMDVGGIGEQPTINITNKVMVIR